MTTIDTSPWLDDPLLKKLLDTLAAVGETRFIGGAVRDTVLGLPPSDIDLATTALPETVVKQAKKSGFKIVPTGIKHGTVTAILPRGPVEITTLRRDVATDGRHATVAFSQNWAEDAARRDFTINALSADAAGTVYDYCDGLHDLANGHVRFIGNAQLRIREDYLRILRLFRFSGRYGRGALDKAALAAIRELAPGMTRLSGERVQSELLKLLLTPRAVEMWQAMIDSGVIAVVLPQALDTKRLQHLIALENKHGMADPLRRLMVLFPAMLSAETDAIARRLKLSGPQKKRIVLAAVYSGRLERVRRGQYGAALYGTEMEPVIDAAMLAAAAKTLATKPLQGFLAFATDWQQPQFPLGGDNLIELGLKPGPVFGSLLKEVETWWVEQNFIPDRFQCFAELKRIWQARKAAEIAG